MNIFKTPFLYLKVDFRHRILLSAVLPALLSFAVTGIIFLMEPNFTVIGNDGYFNSLTHVMTVAGGFFIASLSIILTSNQETLSATFIGRHVPVLKSDNEPLTRKRFLALLFGYLGFTSFIVAGICLIASNFGKSFGSHSFSLSYQAAKFVTIFFVNFLTANIFLNSLIGFHYLVDRLNRADPKSGFSRELPK